jgi:hypothetical protein
VRPVADLLGTVVVNVLVTADAVYAVGDDGTVWRRVGATWRSVGEVPHLPHRLVSASPRVIARWTGTGITYEPGSGDTVSMYRRTPLPRLGVRPADVAPPRRLVVADTVLALLTADGRVLSSSCGLVPSVVGLRDTAVRCAPWRRLPAAAGSIVDVGVLADGGVIGVVSPGLVVTWEGGSARRERLPAGFEGDSLWAVWVSDDGTATVVGSRAVLERDEAGHWSTAPRFAGDGRLGDHLALLPDGDLVVAGKFIHVWGPSTATAPVATVHRPIRGEGDVAALHVLSDGRLVAGFATVEQPGVGGWLRVWAPPARDDRSSRVDLPATIDVTGLADDGVLLYVVGRGGSAAIPLESLPFTDEARRD